MKDSRGQILLLSTLVVCAFLLTLAAILLPLNTRDSTDDTALSPEAFDNVILIQDAGFRLMADEIGRCPWSHRAALAGDYRSRAFLAVSSIEEIMLTRGVACSFAFNQSMARDYVEDNGLTSYESIDGILVKREGDNASICGCAYDLWLSDGSCTYSVSVVKARA